MIRHNKLIKLVCENRASPAQESSNSVLLQQSKTLLGALLGLPVCDQACDATENRALLVPIELYHIFQVGHGKTAS